MLRIDHNFPELHPSSLSASHREPRTKVHILVCEWRLLRVDRRVLWWGHNAINVYHVIVPWRREVSFAEMGISRKQARFENKYPGTSDPLTLVFVSQTIFIILLIIPLIIRLFP